MSQSTTQTTLLIAEDDPLLRGFLTRVLEAEQDFQVLGSVGNGGEVLGEVERLRPQILLLDVNLPGLSGLRVLQQLATRGDGPSTLMLSGNEDEGTQLEAARSGARGFLCKSQALGSIPDVVRKVASGEVWFSPRIVGQIMTDYPTVVRKIRDQEKPINQLSDREQEVLVRVAQGHTNQQIASELFMSVSTVKVHLRNIFSKLNIANRTDAAVFAVREGLLGEEG